MLPLLGELEFLMADSVAMLGLNNGLGVICSKSLPCRGSQHDALAGLVGHLQGRVDLESQTCEMPLLWYL